MFTLIVLIILGVVIYTSYKVFFKKENVKTAIQETKSDFLDKINQKK